MTSELNKVFKEGQIVRLDKDFRNTSLVIVVSQTPLKMYTKVRSFATIDLRSTEWEVCTYRLTEHVPENKFAQNKIKES